jgi:hypothetical protein
MFCGSQANATTQEDAVKAGFIYNFTKFVDWPIQISQPGDFNLCLVGQGRLNGGLDALYGKPVGKMHLVLKQNLGLDDIKSCQMVFITSEAQDHMQGLLQMFAEQKVLTISDSPGFIDQGGMIGLVRDKKHMGFEVNLDAIKGAGLHVSAQLLKLATKVKGNQ